MKFLITAGPTREPLDPVRFLSNRSSGKMGYALAEAAVEAGYEVVLVSGPVALSAPQGVRVYSIQTAQEMWEAVRDLCMDVETAPDIAILAAAVADYRPKVVQGQKIKKSADSLTLDLERTPDILGSMRGAFGFRGVLVGFAAETENLVANAQDKLRRKGCDLIVANDVSRADSGFDSDENEVILCFPSGQTETLTKQSKRTLAREIVRRCVGLAAERPHP
jgi:phosphopantothenoylcysteine decarboxylase/phosphopantothenate--cysteine ligase